LTLLALFLSLSALAFDKDFTTVNDRVPLEFSLLFDSLKLEAKAPADKVRLVGLCQELDQNLGFLGREHIFLLMKTEVTKNVMEHKFPRVRQFDVTTLLLQRLETDFARKEQTLNPFSQWIWRSVLAELRHRRDQGLISERSFNLRSFEGAKLTEARRFERYLTYLVPWIDKMDALSAEDFNALTTEVGWMVLRRLNNRSLLLRRLSSTAAGDTRIGLFNIPERLLNLSAEELKQVRRNETPRTLQEAAGRERGQAEATVNRATPEDLSPMSDDVARELEKESGE
jgi:hypothetical protein